MSRISIESEMDSVRDEIDGAVSDSLTNKQGSGIFDIAVDKARRKIRAHGAVWTNEMIESFKVQLQKDGFGDFYALIDNVSDHADPQNDGAEFDAPPPPENLLPWVTDHMYLFETDSAYDAANALSIHLYQNGLDGIHFMAAARKYLEVEGESDLEHKVNHRL